MHTVSIKDITEPEPILSEKYIFWPFFDHKTAKTAFLPAFFFTIFFHPIAVNRQKWRERRWKPVVAKILLIPVTLYRTKGENDHK